MMSIFRIPGGLVDEIHSFFLVGYKRLWNGEENALAQLGIFMPSKVERWNGV